MDNNQVKLNWQYVGFWLRTWSTLVDSVLISIVIFPILIAIYGWNYFESEKFIKGPLDFLVSWVFPAAAVIIFWRCRSATPGKMLISAQIVDAKTKEKPSNTQFIVRYFAYLVSIIPFFLGFIWIAFDKQKQAWHDKLARTAVIRPLKKGYGH
jgi:uncharacterized RDD family membrane protein YckC